MNSSKWVTGNEKSRQKIEKLKKASLINLAKVLKLSGYIFAVIVSGKYGRRLRVQNVCMKSP